MPSSHPSKVIFHWPRSGKYFEFADFVTHPQGDHRKDGSGVIIRPEFDSRAQPLWQHVKANMHRKGIWCLPEQKAKVEGVREFIYLLLTSKDWSKVPNERPQYITATISHWDVDGASLRRCRTRLEYLALVPKGYIDVYGTYHTIPISYIHAIQDRLYQIIDPLLRNERKEQMIVKELERSLKAGREVEDRRSRLENESINEKIAPAYRKRDRLRGLLCFGQKRDADVKSVDTLPAYREKE